jgi:hypothetical protein
VLLLIVLQGQAVMFYTASEQIRRRSGALRLTYRALVGLPEHYMHRDGVHTFVDVIRNLHTNSSYSLGGGGR